MKNQPFFHRVQFAWNGIYGAFRSEASFRFQILAALGAFLILIFFKADAIWWAFFALIIGAVLACELLNTALEHLMDRIHPEQHDSIKLAKDCAAGAVLILSLVSLIILICFLVQHH